MARFVFESRKLGANNAVKAKAFEPERHPATGVFETSVCGLTGVSPERLWAIGRTVRRDKPAIAAIEIEVRKIVAANLRCQPAPGKDPIDFPEHGVIIGWDSEDKSKRLATQQNLAANCTRVLFPDKD